MINPTPVSNRQTPYKGTGSDKRQKPTLPPSRGTSRSVNIWKKVFALSLFGFLVAGSGYAYATYTSIKNSALVEHEGDRSSVLSIYSEGREASPALFKKAGDGRFHVVLVGIGGENHPGALLTDSIQVLSLDPINNRVGITSLPRDLYVSVPGYGPSKINATYSIGENKKSGSGSTLLRGVVSDVTGVSVSNFVLIDFSGVKSLVDTLGGIDVQVAKDIYDPTYPDSKSGYSPFRIKAGLQHMNGETALKYSRSRHTTSDFDRSARQQQVIAAMKKKASTAGILLNPAKVLELMSTLGKHIKTDMQVSEIQTFIKLYNAVPAENTTTTVLDTSEKLGLLQSSSNTSAGYIAYPLGGYTAFQPIHAWFQKNNPDPYIKKEAATISIAAGANTTQKQLQAQATLLTDYGYTVTIVTTPYPKTTTTSLSHRNNKPISQNYLSSYFDITSQSNSPLSSASDFEVIYVAQKK
jgi:LCP family protein required for cell wall assembly